MSTATMSEPQAERVTRLFELYSARVLGLARSRTTSPQIAQDVAGETWLRVVRSIDRLRASDDAAWSWLATITRYAAADYYRPFRSHERPTDWAEDGHRLPAAPSAEAEAVARLTLTERLTSAGVTR
ncbi:sigma-70 family RNA polymerase sigma factor [Nonomuraea sp. NPDC026600]|uniref:RNA polymerase sigma factor n=1 Tax=Nonomuraea sp. NPDC026600 TaxID=3155363 RepID=UPI0033F5FFD4